MNPIARNLFTLCLACSTAAAMSTPPSSTDMLPYDSAVKDAERWGRLMYDHDQAAWNATDLVLKDPGFRDDKRLRGWITEATDAGVRVVFVGEDGGKLVGLYESTPSASSTLIRDTPGRALTDDERAAFSARHTANASLREKCTEKYNSVVLPEGVGNDHKWRVYLLPAVTDSTVVPFGGYYRYEISADGNTVLAQRPFTKTCAMLANNKDSNMPAGYRPVGMMITHLLDPQPTEVHVFVSLTYQQPVYVMTDAGMWNVAGDHIEAIKIKPSVSPSPTKH